MRILLSALLLCLFGSRLGAQQPKNWREAFERFPIGSNPNQEDFVFDRCGGFTKDSLAIVSRPDVRDQALVLKINGSYGFVMEPAEADTVRGLITSAHCDEDGNLTSMRFEAWGRETLIEFGEPLERKRDIDPYIRFLVPNERRTREAGWDGVRFIDVAVQRARNREAATRAADAKRAAELQRAQNIRGMGWPPEMAEAVIRRQVAIGMTTAMVRAAWGAPGRINTTIRAAGRDEQWVYGESYIYFTRGVVRAMQTSR